jgi:hypothetical protein
MHDPGREKVKNERAILDLYGVSSVVPTLITDHDVEVLGEKIYDLAFAFIAPLGADYYYDFAH